jgi:hypothetical protein
MGVVAGAYHISHRWGLITKQNVFQKNLLFCGPVTRSPLELHNLWADSLNGSDMGIGLPDMMFAIHAFKVFMFIMGGSLYIPSWTSQDFSPW